MSFFAILFTFYGLPIHILRDVVLTVRSFVRRIADFLRYRNATRDMNERYPDATAEEVANEEVCIICREEMTPWEQPGGEGEAAGRGDAAPARRPAGAVSDRLRPKKLPCGHILHFACLRSWLERQQNCPTCRRPVVSTTRARIYPGQGNDNRRANAGVVGQQPDAGQAPAGGQGQLGQGQAGARVFNFGPLRVGFGAGRGDLFRNLAQQVQGRDPQGAQANPNEPAQPGRQQIGFGFGFGRAAAPPVNQPPQPNTSGIQQQLSQIELQITQEINNLRITADQLHTVRLLQAELARLRSAQTNPNGLGAVPTNPTVTTVPAYASQPIISSTVQRQVTVNQTSSMGSGDSQLPEGLTLPEGWTLVPLQRVEQLPVNLGQSGPSFIPPSSHAGAPPPPPFASASHTNHTNPTGNPTVTTGIGQRAGPETTTLNQSNIDTTHTNSVSSSTNVSVPSTAMYSEPNVETPEARSTERTGQTVGTDGTARSASPPLGSSWTEVSSDGLLDKQDVHQSAANGSHGGESAESSHTNGHVEETERDEKGKAKAVTVEDVDDDTA